MPNPHSQLWRWEVAAMLGAQASDSPPSSPSANQLWWESDTGALFIWYVDPDSAQWVQISQPSLDFVYRAGDTMTGLLTLSGPPTAALHAATKAYVDGPSDGNEYVIVNGVRRLKSQTFDLTSKASQDVTIPAWGPTQARLTSFAFSTVGGQSGIRLSGDGVTFDAGNIYSMAGFYHIAGGAGSLPNYPNTANTFWLMASGSDNASLAMNVDAVLNLVPGAANYFTCRVRSGAYAAANGMIHYNFDGWMQPTTGAGALKAFRFFLNSGSFINGKLVVEWLA